MKKMKKFVSLMLAVVMMMAMSAAVFAADTSDDPTGSTTTGTITVENPIADETYTAYKIFDVIYNDRKTAYAYTIKGDSEWYDVIENYSELDLTRIGDSNVYNVEMKDSFSAAGFAAKLKENITGKTGTELTAEGDVVKATGLELGYYFVASTKGALCNLTTTDPSAKIHDKNDMAFTGIADKTTVEVGEKVTFTIKGKVPNTTGFTSYTYKIFDTMTEGLTFDINSSEFSITVGGTKLNNDYTLTQSLNGYGNGYELTIDVTKLQDYVGKEIVITYKATVNEKAVANISKNSAKLEYSNDPTQNTTTTTTPIEASFYSAKIVLESYVSGDNDTKLAGAKFVLKNSNNKFYKYDADKKQVSWVDDQADATEVTTDENGAAEFSGLKDGTYYLKETEAPKGYNMIARDAEIKIDGSKATESNLTSLTHTETVAHSAGSILPATGGIGTTIFYVLGSILVLGAAFVLVVRRRMDAK